MGRRYLIGLEDALVAQDVSEIVSEFEPDARLVFANTLAETMAAFQTEEEPFDVVVTDTRASSWASVPDRSLFDQAMTKVVALWDVDTEEYEGFGSWILVSRPFTSFDLLNALRSAFSQSAQ